ncbi:2331_t:CDS:1, partial [Dentiscutata heterogama]
VSKMIWSAINLDANETIVVAKDVLIGVLLDAAFLEVIGKVALAKITVLVTKDVIKIDITKYLKNRVVENREFLHKILEEKLKRLQQASRKTIVNDNRDKINFENEQ